MIIPTTTNCAEGFNNGIRETVSVHSKNLYKYILALKDESICQRNLYIHLNNATNCPISNKKSAHRKEQILTIVKRLEAQLASGDRYQDDRINVIEYLDAVSSKTVLPMPNDDNEYNTDPTNDENDEEDEENAMPEE